MKSEYIELVPVRFNKEGKTYLHQAKAFKTFHKGDIVRVEGNNDRFAKVAADSKTVRVVDVLGATEPLKRIVGVFTPIEYDDGVVPF